MNLHLSYCVVEGNTTGGGVKTMGRANLLVEECTISGNASTGDGGGIATAPRTRLTLSATTVEDNAAAGGGGGIDARGSLRLEFSTVRANDAGGDGGGIRSADRFALIRSTVSGNEALGDGGGVHVAARPGSATLDNSTVSGNAAGGDGGGVHVDSNRRLNVVHATIAGNTAGGRGGGLYARATSSPKPTTLSGTLLADNAGATEPDCSADRVLAKHGNLIEDPTGCTLVAAQGAPVVSADPLLGPLQDNGGRTETRVPAAGSPALEIVTSRAACSFPDQRPSPRFPPTCDAGAFESN